MDAEELKGWSKLAMPLFSVSFCSSLPCFMQLPGTLQSIFPFFQLSLIGSSNRASMGKLEGKRGEGSALSCCW